MLLRWLGGRNVALKKPDPRRSRLWLERLEDRFVPATFKWTGPANGLWSNQANWDQNNGVPGVNDTALFDGTTNTDSKMDLQTTPGTLKIQGYNGTIKLQRVLIIDILTMSSGTITIDTNWLD